MTESRRPFSAPQPETIDDDLSPETLIREDGARSAREVGADKPTDWDLSIVDATDIGGGSGLDEAELARRDPLDGNP
ncbi:serine kinase/phosphatase [Pseudomonas sp. TKO26]|nr:MULTISPECIES: serine kinase/phosphatase [unclassified Pseudomonas]PYY91976.1 serine kinase/phosphatase [Pseudomonas sp. TKO30]PYY94339.1 serine kinase/phosphatase [Pseudomonas sp. TKO29]PYY96212.1 serine kinase/phosphatase [Pseudomonas sp. TKO26]PYZ01804.1 serine kinase/phosphatase [Pseudomonas sp. TKO14]